jgi:hypothetical protein
MAMLQYKPILNAKNGHKTMIIRHIYAPAMGPSECFLPSSYVVGEKISSSGHYSIRSSCHGLCANRAATCATERFLGCYRLGMTFQEKGPAAPSLTVDQLPVVLVRLLRVFCRMTLVRTSLRPRTLPKRRTSGRSRSKGSDCRTVLPVGGPGVNKPVAGRLGPGSPK